MTFKGWMTLVAYRLHVFLRPLCWILGHTFSFSMLTAKGGHHIPCGRCDKTLARTGPEARRRNWAEARRLSRPANERETTPATLATLLIGEYMLATLAQSLLLALLAGGALMYVCLRYQPDEVQHGE